MWRWEIVRFSLSGLVMQVISKGKNFRVSPRKARLVADAIRGLKVEEAVSVLKFAKCKSAKLFLGVVTSGMASMRNGGLSDLSSARVVEARVDEGLKMKRFMPRAQGRATPIRKRRSHLIISLAD